MVFAWKRKQVGLWRVHLVLKDLYKIYGESYKGDKGLWRY